MRKEEIVKYEVAYAMYRLGYKPINKFEGLCYAKRTQLREDVYQRFGELTDDGYYDLTVDGGGELPWEEVYEYSIGLDRYYGFGEEIPAPTMYEAAQWLRDVMNIFIDVRYVKYNTWEYNMITLTDGLKHRTVDYYPTYEHALMTGVENTILAMVIAGGIKNNENE